MRRNFIWPRCSSLLALPFSAVDVCSAAKMQTVLGDPTSKQGEGKWETGLESGANRWHKSRHRFFGQHMLAGEEKRKQNGHFPSVLRLIALTQSYCQRRMCVRFDHLTVEYE